MKQRIVLLFIISLLLTGCGSPATATQAALIPTVELAATSAPLLPTETPTATSVATATPIPDLGTLGFPRLPAGTVAYDFVAEMCAAQWYNRGASLPCPGDASQMKAAAREMNASKRISSLS